MTQRPLAARRLSASTSLLLVGAAAWLGGLGGMVVPAAQADIVKIMPLGDSITAGGDGGYRTLLYNLLIENGHTVDFVGSTALNKDVPWLPDHNHEGHGGWRVDNLQRNIVQWMTDHEPDVIFLHIGTNDISNGETAIGVSRDLSELIGMIVSVNPEIELHVAGIICRIDQAPKPGITKKYVALTPHVVEAWANLGYDVRYVHMFGVIGPDDLADDIHPNPHGYDKMALEWFRSYTREPAAMPLKMTWPFAGEECTLSVTNATPGESVYFFGTTAELGETWQPELGVTLEMKSPQLLGVTMADADGKASFTATVAPELSQSILRVQAATSAATGSGEVSQVMVRKVRN